MRPLSSFTILLFFISHLTNFALAAPFTSNGKFRCPHLKYLKYCVSDIGLILLLTCSFHLILFNPSQALVKMDGITSRVEKVDNLKTMLNVSSHSRTNFAPISTLSLIVRKIS